MSDQVIADILRPDVDENGAPVANIGEQTDGLGFGADTSVWGNGDGFVSVPNPPSDAGAAQAIVEQDGHVKRATQTRDQRWVTKAGTLAVGDKAIVTDSDAYFRLTRADDKIEIVSGSMSITVDGSGSKITLTHGINKIELTAAAILMQFGPSAAPAPGSASVKLSATGVDIVVAPTQSSPPALDGFRVNSTPMIVP